MADRKTGSVKQWVNSRGFGFLIDHQPGEGVFVHMSALNRIGLTELTHGQSGKASKMAVNLKMLSDDKQAAA
jgi:cold shock CspA family protein